MSVDAAGLFSPLATALSVAVLNGLWQGAFIGVIAAGTLAAMSRRSAQARYGVACLALAAMLAAFAATFGWALAHAIDAHAAPAAMASGGSLHPAGLNTSPSSPDWWPAVLGRSPVGVGGSQLPFDGAWLAAAWLVGAAVVALVSVFQFAAVRRLTVNANYDVRDRWRDAFEAVSHDVRLGRLARLAHSAAVEVPTVVGWFAPVVLVPPGAFTALSHDELCAILAHELAHIRRQDYLVNAAQKVVEVVLFFHPVTWWLSHRIRVEREYCCDDVAVRQTNSALTYARALSQLETLRARRHDYAMGADGGSLMNRIARIAGAKPEGRRLGVIGSALLGVFVAMVGMAFVVVGNASADSGTPTPTAAKTAPGPKAPPPADTNAAPPEIVAAVHAALQQLVADGTINQSQADTIEQDASAGQVDGSALVAQGVLTGAQMQTVEDALGQVKQSFASAGTDTVNKDAGAPGSRTKIDAEAASASCDQITSKLAQAVADGKMTQEQANEQIAGASCSSTP